MTNVSLLAQVLASSRRARPEPIEWLQSCRRAPFPKASRWLAAHRIHFHS